jgi:precorrin-2 dehydrogenase/sirohydrochlorin ferrochelatase
MKYYPVFLDVKDKRCLVVGGGAVGARKAATLEKCGARVVVVSERFSERFDDLETKNIRLENRKYDRDDVADMFLVFAATDDAGLNARIKKDAAALNILCNVADAPDESEFILPSIVERGDLLVAVSTCGSSPAMAKKIRQELDAQFGEEYAQLLQLMGNMRRKLLSQGHDPQGHKKIFHSLIDKGILDLIKTGDEKNINVILNDIPGEGYTYRDLVSVKER